jgi:hypothetical protein
VPCKPYLSQSTRFANNDQIGEIERLKLLHTTMEANAAKLKAYTSTLESQMPKSPQKLNPDSRHTVEAALTSISWESDQAAKNILIGIKRAVELARSSEKVLPGTTQIYLKSLREVLELGQQVVRRVNQEIEDDRNESGNEELEIASNEDTLVAKLGHSLVTLGSKIGESLGILGAGSGHEQDGSPVSGSEGDT